MGFEGAGIVLTPEMALLFLESVLLIATITLLIYSIKEGRARDKVLREMAKTTRILTRQDYFNAVIDAMQKAEKEVFGCITGRVPKGGDRKQVDKIISTLKTLSRRGVTIRYLLPKLPDRLCIGHQYTKAGAEVRYSNCLFVNDSRYMVVDDRFVILGIPEEKGDKEPTKKGYRVPSEGLGRILNEHFYNCWEHNIPYWDYLREVVKQTNATPSLLAKELRVSEEEVRKITAEDLKNSADDSN
jgi:hypothetical protein